MRDGRAIVRRDQTKTPGRTDTQRGTLGQARKGSVVPSVAIDNVVPFFGSTVSLLRAGTEARNPTNAPLFLPRARLCRR